MSSSDSEGLGRLSRAVTVYFAWKEADDGTPFADLLERHPELEELLIGMRDEEHEEAEERKQAHSRSSFASTGAAEGDFAGQRLGGYVLGRLLGRGAMGIVHEAHDPELGRRVAIKVLPLGSTTSPAHLARFRREASLVAQLEHEGVVKILRVGFDDGLHWFAMDLVQGVPLNELVQRVSENTSAADLRAEHLPRALRELAEERGLAVPKSAGDDCLRDLTSWDDCVAQLVLRIGRALHHAHETGVIHRDVKPSNILVRADGRPVLTDFGLAREEALPSMTQTGDFAGTPYYVAPEQILGRPSEIDRRSDVFSLGVTLYELMTLERPFDAASTHGVLQAILTREPRDPSRYRRVPRDLVAICCKAIEKERANRYASAADFADDLQRFLERRPVQARRTSGIRRLGRWAQREPLRAGLLFVAIPLLTALLGFVAALLPEIRAGQRARLRSEIAPMLSEAYSEIFEGDDQHAQAVFGLVLEKDPGNVDARTGLAVTLLKRMRSAEVLAELERWTDIPAEHARLRIFLQAWGLETAGKQDEADALRQKLGTPSTYQETFVEGIRVMELAHKTGSDSDYELALDLFQRALLLAGMPQPPLLYQIAHVAGHVRRPMLAQRICDVLLDRFPEAPEAWFWAGFAKSSTDPVRSLEYRRHAMEIAKDPERRLQFFRRYVTGLATVRPRRAVQEIERLLADDRYRNRVDLHYLLAHCHRQVPDDEAERTVLRRALALDPQGEYNLVRHAEALRRTGRRQEAIAILRDLTGSHPGHGQLWAELARCLAETGQAEACLQACVEGLAHVPSHAVLLDLHSEHARKLGQLDAAERSALRLRELLPDQAMGHGHLGRIRLQQRRHADAAEALEEAVRFANAGELQRERTNLSSAYVSLGRYEETIALLRLVIDSGYESWVVYLNRALAEIGLGEYAHAIDSLHEARALEDSHHQIHYQLGYCYSRLGDLRRSVDAYARALELRPGLEDVHRWLIGACEELGDIGLVRKYCESWLAEHPEDHPAQFTLARALLSNTPTTDDVARARAALLAARRDPVIAGHLDFAEWWATLLAFEDGIGTALAWIDGLHAKIDDPARRARLLQSRARILERLAR